MTDTPIAQHFDELLNSTEPLPTTVLDELWDQLTPLRAESLIGEWQGAAFPTTHRLTLGLEASRWYGKRFNALDDVQPLLCRDEDGNIFSNVDLGRGEASLWNIEFRGEVTATMVYDGQPVFDHFKQLDADTLMGIMNGKPSLVLDNGEHFYFALRRAA